MKKVFTVMCIVIIALSQVTTVSAQETETDVIVAGGKVQDEIVFDDGGTKMIMTMASIGIYGSFGGGISSNTYEGTALFLHAADGRMTLTLYKQNSSGEYTQVKTNWWDFTNKNMITYTDTYSMSSGNYKLVINCNAKKTGTVTSETMQATKYYTK